MKILEKLLLVNEMTIQLYNCLLDYTYFKKYYKMITVDLSKQQVLDADPKEIQQIIVTANLDRENTRFYFILEEATELLLNFHKEL